MKKKFLQIGLGSNKLMENSEIGKEQAQGSGDVGWGEC